LKQNLDFFAAKHMRKGYRSLFCVDISEIRESTSGEYRHGIEVIALAALGLNVLLQVKLCSALVVNSFSDDKGVARGFEIEREMRGKSLPCRLHWTCRMLGTSWHRRDKLLYLCYERKFMFES
jgi:hypothetical protein